MKKLLYKPVAIVAGLISGMIASAIFKQVWKLARHEDHPPEAMEAQRGWSEVLIAAAIHGAIFAAVKAAVDRSAAVGTRRVTGVWPGKEADADGTT